MSRYKFYGTPEARVICVSSYAGRKVRAVATCSKEDDFDFEKGKALAQARVDVEIARRKLKNADKKVCEAEEMRDAADCHLFEMERYYDDAEALFEEAEENLENLLEEM